MWALRESVMKRIVLSILALALVAGCSDEDKKRIAELENENQQLKTRLQIMESEHPLLDLQKLQQFGREQLLTSRASLAGVNSVRATLDKITPLTTKDDIKTNIIQPLHVLQDMWPAYGSEANKTIDPMFQPCRDLPVLNRLSVEAAQAGLESVLNKASDLEKLVRFQCSLALSAAVQAKK